MMLKQFRERVLNLTWKHLQVFLQKILLSTNLFLKNELINHAGACAFFFFLSITPLFLLILISFDRYLASYPDVSAHFFDFLKTINENLDKDFLVKIGILNVNTTAIGIFGILNLLWAGRWVIIGIQRGLGIIFPAEKARPPIMVNILSFLFLSILLVISVLVTFVSVGLKFLESILSESLMIQTLFQSLLPLLKGILPVLMTFLVIFAAYRFVPIKRPKTLPSLIGAVFCSLSVILLHVLFAKFFNVARYNVIYGVLGSLILMVLWMHFSFILFFFFAEFTFVSDKIDILVLERMYVFQSQQDRKGKKIGKFLFSHPEQVFEKYAIYYSPGEILFQEGDGSTDIYFIYQGSIGIYRTVNETERKIAVIQEGEIFGEMAYLLEESRTATAKAETDTILMVITPDIFEELLLVNRIVSRDVIQTLSNRLRKTQLPEKP